MPAPHGRRAFAVSAALLVALALIVALRERSSQRERDVAFETLFDAQRALAADATFAKATPAKVTDEPMAPRSSRACRVEGRCTPKADGGLVAQSEADCVASLRCALYGFCTLEAGRCVLGPRDCPRSASCRTLGMCTFVAERRACELTGPEDCRRSRSCSADRLRCSYQPATRAGSPVGALHAAFCYGGTTEACRATAACRAFGECRIAPDARGCIADEAGCRASEACRLFGWCAAARGCMPLTIEHCRASLGCRELGLCDIERGGEAGETAWCGAPPEALEIVSVTAGPDDASSIVGVRPTARTTTAAWSDFDALRAQMSATEVRRLVGAPSRFIAAHATDDDPDCEVHPDGFVLRDLCPVVHEYEHADKPPTRITYSRRGQLLRATGLPRGDIEPTRD